MADLGAIALLRAQKALKLIHELPSGMHPKGSVNYFADLPTTGVVEGDAYTVLQNDGTHKPGVYVYKADGTWAFFHGLTEIDSVLNATSNNALANSGVYTALESYKADLVTLINGKLNKSLEASVVYINDASKNPTVIAYDINPTNKSIVQRDTNGRIYTGSATSAGHAVNLQQANNTYVAKVDGKGLSTNDLTNELKANYDAAYSSRHTHTNKTILDAITAAFTTDHKTKLAGIEESAQVNIIESIKVDGSALPISGKSVNIDLTGKRDKINTTSFATFDKIYLQTSDKNESFIIKAQQIDSDGLVTGNLVKNYVDTQDNAKLDKIITASTYRRLYMITTTGAQNTIDISNDFTIDDNANLADIKTIKSFVNSSIQAAAANKVTTAAGDNFNTRAALIAGPWYHAGNPYTLQNNDYAIVKQDETHSNMQYRYKYVVDTVTLVGAWQPDFSIGSEFTAAQQNAIDSGITSALVTTYNNYATNKMDKADGVGTGNTSLENLAISGNLTFGADAELDFGGSWAELGKFAHCLVDEETATTNSIINKQYVDTKIIRRAGAPTSSTSANLGVYYIDSTTGKAYRCIAKTGTTFTWELQSFLPLSGGDIAGWIRFNSFTYMMSDSASSALPKTGRIINYDNKGSMSISGGDSYVTDPHLDLYGTGIEDKYFADDYNHRRGQFNLSTGTGEYGRFEIVGKTNGDLLWRNIADATTELFIALRDKNIYTNKSRADLYATCSNMGDTKVFNIIQFSATESPSGQSSDQWECEVHRTASGSESTEQAGYIIAKNGIGCYISKLNAGTWAAWTKFTVSTDLNNYYKKTETDAKYVDADKTELTEQTRATVFAKTSALNETKFLNKVIFTAAESPTGSNISQFECEVHRTGVAPGEYGYIFAKNRSGFFVCDIYPDGETIHYSNWKEIPMSNWSRGYPTAISTYVKSNHSWYFRVGRLVIANINYSLQSSISQNTQVYSGFPKAETNTYVAVSGDSKSHFVDTNGNVYSNGSQTGGWVFGCLIYLEKKD